MMKNYLTLITLILAVANLSMAAEQVSTVVPVPSTLKKFMPRLHNQILEEGKSREIDWVMIGDSITHGWSRHPRFFTKSKMLNLGFPGDRTQNVLWRLQHGELDSVKPRLVTLMIGTNHMHETKKSFTADSTEDIFTGIQAVVAEIRTRLPDAQLVILSVLPRRHPGENARVEALNAVLPQLADGKQITYSDITSHFRTSEGTYNPKLYSRDGLHLNAAGYAAWEKALASILQANGISH